MHERLAFIAASLLAGAAAATPSRTSVRRAGDSGRTTSTTITTARFTDHSDTLVYLTYFNAGLRVYDISDATLPREVAWFIPPDPVHRYGPQPVGSLVEQTEDVLVDTRGYIYVTNKNQGLWILKLDREGEGGDRD